MINFNDGYREKFKRDFAEIWFDLFKVCKLNNDGDRMKLVFVPLDFVARLESVHSFLHIVLCPLFHSDYTSQGGGHIIYTDSYITDNSFERRLQYIETHLKKRKEENE